jgi:hypothetical protein
MRRLAGVILSLFLFSPSAHSEDLECDARVSHFCNEQRCVTRYFSDRLKLEFSRRRAEFCRSERDCEEHELVAEDLHGNILVRAGPDLFLQLFSSGKLLLMKTIDNQFARVTFLTCGQAKPLS